MTQNMAPIMSYCVSDNLELQPHQMKGRAQDLRSPPQFQAVPSFACDPIIKDPQSHQHFANGA